MPSAPKPALVATPVRAEPQLSPTQEAELLAALRVSPKAHEPHSKRVSNRLIDMGLLVDQDSGRYRLTAAGREMASQLFASRVISEANARRVATLKRKAAAGVPPNWPFPESHHVW